jgi:TonB family protein
MREETIAMEFRGHYGVMLALAIVPACVRAQDVLAQDVRAQDMPAPPPARADDKSAPAQPIGNVAQFFGTDAYPPDAIRAKEQGRSVAKVTVDASGTVTGCTTVVSSGSVSLDAKTCTIAMTSIKYVAARDARGSNIAGGYILPVRWVLPVDEPRNEQAFITFSGTAAAPVCSVRVAQVWRHILPDKCRVIANVILSHGGNLGQTLPIGIPAEADLYPPGE